MRFNGILLRRRPWWEQFSRQNWEIGEFTARCPASLVEIILIFHATEKRKFQLKRISALRYSAFGICIRIRIRISYPNPYRSFHTDCDCYFADSQFNGEEHVHIIAAKQLHSSVFVCVLRICIWLAAYLYLCIHILQLAGRAMSQLACQPLVGPRSSFKWFWNWFHLIANYNILLWHILTTSGMSYMRTL